MAKKETNPNALVNVTVRKKNGTGIHNSSGKLKNLAIDGGHVDIVFKIDGETFEEAAENLQTFFKSQKVIKIPQDPQLELGKDD